MVYKWMDVKRDQSRYISGGAFCLRFGVGCSRRHTPTTGRSWYRWLQATNMSASVNVDRRSELQLVSDGGGTCHMSHCVHFLCVVMHGHPSARYR